MADRHPGVGGDVRSEAPVSNADMVEGTAGVVDGFAAVTSRLRGMPRTGFRSQLASRLRLEGKMRDREIWWHRTKARVLEYIATSPISALREIAGAVGITERSAQTALKEMEMEGLIKKRRSGRRNEYLVSYGRLLESSLDQPYGKLANIAAALEGRLAYNLTFREIAVLHHIAAGEGNKMIAAALGISPMTVHKHVGAILGKMGASSRTEAGIRALREGLLEAQQTAFASGETLREITTDQRKVSADQTLGTRDPP